MSDSAQDGPTRGPEPPANDRLESWKDIAAYLGKDVSTLHRWEKDAGLPVYRSSQDKVRNVYAYRSELDAWQNTRRTLPADEETVNHSHTGAQVPRWWTRWPAVAAGILVAVVVTGSLVWIAWNGRARTPEQVPTLDVLSRAGDAVLITRFENRTGEALYDGTLKLALERELSNSSVVRVASPERVEDALRLMTRPVDTVVDASLGREVALRDGGIRLILTGHIEKFGPNYVLTVQLLDPQDGRVLASVSEEARDERAITSALGRQASRVREILGEALPLIEASERRLEKVTTPSLRALQLYSRGYARYRESSKSLAAAELFREAIAEDPEFASAHNMLGWSVFYQDRPREEYLPHFKRAVDLSESTTERDRLFIEGVYYSHTGEHDKAAAKYEALLDLHPDHYYAANNLEWAYRRLGRESATEVLVRQADLRPNDPHLQMRAAILLIRAGQPERANVYLERGADLRPTDPEWQMKMASGLTRAGQLDRANVYVERARALYTPSTLPAFLAFFPAYEHWFRGEVDEAFLEVEAVLPTIAAGSPLERDLYSGSAGTFYLAFGQLGKAKTLFETVGDPLRHHLLATLADCLDDQEGFKEYMSALGGMVSDQLLRQVRAGLPVEPADLASAAGSQRQLAQGELARRRGDWRDAIALLEPGGRGRTGGCR